MAIMSCVHDLPDRLDSLPRSAFALVSAHHQVCQMHNSQLGLMQVPVSG